MNVSILVGYTSPDAHGMAPAQILGAFDEDSHTKNPQILQDLIDQNSASMKIFSVMNLDISDDEIQKGYQVAMDLAANEKPDSIVDAIV